jgi:ABC-type transporter MlaC component
MEFIMKKILLISFLFLFSLANANNIDARNAVYKSVYKINQFSGAKYPPHIIDKFIKSEILPLFDFDYISSEILKNIPSKFKKTGLIIRLKNDIANTIMQSLIKARGRVFVPKGVRKSGNNIILSLRVGASNVDLAMHSSKNGWKIFDIALKGQSLVAYYKKLVSRR